MSVADILKKNLIFKSSVIIAGITVFTKLLGYVEKIVVAYYWGTGYQADTYYAVVTIIISVSLLFREITEPGLLNMLVRTRSENGESESDKAYTSVLWFIAAIGLVLSVSFYFFPGSVSSLLLSGFEGTRAELSTLFFRIAGIGLFFLIITTITNTYLLSHKWYIAIAVSELVYKSVIIFVLLMAAGFVGVIATIISVVVGAIVKFLLQFVRANWKKKINFISTDRNYIYMLLLVCWPLAIGNIFSQLGVIAHNGFASYMAEGALSALSYAKKIIDLPVVIFPYTLSVVVFPFFSQLSAENNKEKMNKLMTSSLKYIMIFFLPLTVFVGFFHGEIVSVIFERGAFDAGSTMLTSSALAVYNFGMVVISLETILVIFLFANGKIKLPVVIGIICVAIDILVTFLLIKSLSYLGIAWAYVIARWIKVLLLLYFVRGNLKSVSLLNWKTGTVLVLTFCAGLLLFPVRRFVLPMVSGTLATAGLLFATGLLMFGAYFYILYRTRIIYFDHE